MDVHSCHSFVDPAPTGSHGSHRVPGSTAASALRLHGKCPLLDDLDHVRSTKDIKDEDLSEDVRPAQLITYITTHNC